MCMWTYMGICGVKFKYVIGLLPTIGIDILSVTATFLRLKKQWIYNLVIRIRFDI